jgi:hypothetical protein
LESAWSISILILLFPLLLIIWAWEEDNKEDIIATVIINIKIKVIVPKAMFCCM